MRLNFSGIGGNTAAPQLRLRTLAGENHGVISGVSNLKFDINYAEVSMISFDVAFSEDGIINPMYGLLTSYKEIYTEDHGIYILESPKKEGDGVREIKTVTGYSIEKLFEKKQLYLQEGTYNFWDAFDSEDTILGRVLELDPTWSVGYISPRLKGCYRTFDTYSADALSFCYGDCMEKYNCTVVFDVYERTINAYDASESPGAMPVYLSYRNLVESVGVEELTDGIVTKLRVYGADDLSIREVNPIGTDYIVDLSYFAAKGDLDVVPDGDEETLATQVQSWQAQIAARQPYYALLTSQRYAHSTQLLLLRGELAELNAALEGLIAQQSVAIQAYAMDSTQQAEIDRLYSEIASQKELITRKDGQVADAEAQDALYAQEIGQIVDALKPESYFSEAALAILRQYFIEDTVEEPTFVASDINAEASGENIAVAGDIKLSGGDISYGETSFGEIVSAYGSQLLLPGLSFTADAIRCTVDLSYDSGLLLTAYLGSIQMGDAVHPGGTVVIRASYESIGEVTDQDGVITERSFSGCSGVMYFTANVSEYQSYTVAQELYTFGAAILRDASWPVYEFTLNSANFLHQEAFRAFQSRFALGESAYLNLGSEGVVSVNLLGVSINYESLSDFSLTFSNRFRLRNGTEMLADMLRRNSASGRKFDVSRYIYDQSVKQSSAVSKFMRDSLDAAVNKIIGASNQSVVIDGAGIHVGGESSTDQLRIVDNMIAMTDDGWQTAKLAIGRFKSKDVGEYWGVNAEVIGGNLIVGNNLVLENELYDENNRPTGIMQFKVDSTGAWLNNSRLVLQKDGGGRMLIDPKYGIVAGTEDLFTVSGTQVTPSFLDDDGSIVLDDDGLPTNANFYLDLTDGSAYFRGVLNAKEGSVGGWQISENRLYSGSGTTYVGLSSNAGDTVAIWAGGETAEGAPFRVNRDGSLYADNGTFSGTVKGATFQDSSGNAMMSNGKFKQDYLTLTGLLVADDLGENGTTKIDGGRITTGTIKAERLDLSGCLTASDVGSGGTTSIDGGRIKTGTISADRIAANSITIGKLAEGVIPTVPTDLSGFANSPGYQTATGVVNIVNGTVDADYIYALGVVATVLRGQNIEIQDSKGTECGVMSVTNSATAGTYAVDFSSSNALRLSSNTGYNAFLGSGSTDGVGPFVMCQAKETDGTPEIQLGGGVLVVPDNSIGNEAKMLKIIPKYGRVFFVIS